LGLATFLAQYGFCVTNAKDLRRTYQCTGCAHAACKDW